MAAGAGRHAHGPVGYQVRRRSPFWTDFRRHGLPARDPGHG